MYTVGTVYAPGGYAVIFEGFLQRSVLDGAFQAGYHGTALQFPGGDILQRTSWIHRRHENALAFAYKIAAIQRGAIVHKAVGRKPVQRKIYGAVLKSRKVVKARLGYEGYL